MKIQTRVVTKTIHEVQYKDQFGRWLRYMEYDDLETAKTKGTRQARSYAKSVQEADWTGYLEPGRDHIPRTPHGD
jgi:hypothetical protein